MDKKSALLVFYTLLIPFLIFGFTMSFIGAEPYPAVVFPGFREVGTTENNLQFEQPEIKAYANGQFTLLEQGQILANIPEVNHPTMMLQRFRYPNGIGGKQVTTRLGWMYLKISAGPVTYPESTIEELEDHMAGVLEKLLGEPADSLVIDWFRYSGQACVWDIEPLNEKVVLHFQSVNQ